MKKIDPDLMLLLEDDLTLFEEMRGNYVSENERVFFETIEQKEINDFSSMYDMLMLEPDNEIGFFLQREYWNEYELGIGKRSCEHCDSLREALTIDMFSLGHTEHISVLQWLRQRDYAGIHYDRDNDKQ